MNAGSVPHIAAVVLAAGRSSRMGRNKLLLPLADGRRLIEHVVDQVLASGAYPVIVVVGHEAAALRDVLASRDVVFVENSRFADGLSTSLQAGIRALPAGAAGFFVCLGDMPAVGVELLRRMMAALAVDENAGIVVPVRDGGRGNPILWSARYIPDFMAITGDVGAKHLLAPHADRIIEIEAEDHGVFVDLDTPEALARFTDDPPTMANG